MRGVDHEDVARRRRPACAPACRRPRRRRPRRRRRSRPLASLVASGYCSRLTKSLTVIRPCSRPASSTSGSFSTLCWRSSSQRLVRAHADRRGDQRHRGHDLADRAGLVGLEAHVAVGHDADQHAVGVDHRQAGDAVAAAQLVDLAQGVVRRAGDRVGDHAGLGPLHHVDLLSLVLDGQVAVQHADAALARHRDRHPGLGDRVHGRGEQRHPHRDVAGDPAGGVGLARHESDSAGSSRTSSKVSPIGANFSGIPVGDRSMKPSDLQRADLGRDRREHVPPMVHPNRCARSRGEHGCRQGTRAADVGVTVGGCTMSRWTRSPATRPILPSRLTTKTVGWNR